MMEFCLGGSLTDLLASPGRASWFDATARVATLCQIAMGMAYVHEAGFIHRDLNPQRVLFDERHRVNITGFESTGFADASATQTSGIGDTYYAAPEMHHGVEYTNRVDVFSFTVMAYEIVVGRRAFVGLSVRRILAGKRPEIPKNVPLIAADLITRCWQANPVNRMSLKEIVDYMHENQFGLLEGVNGEAVAAVTRAIEADAA
jgi:serine/threonine protein kinase